MRYERNPILRADMLTSVLYERTKKPENIQRALGSPDILVNNPTKLFTKAAEIIFKYGRLQKDACTPFYHRQTKLIPVGPNGTKIRLRQFVPISEVKTKKRYLPPWNIEFIVQEGSRKPCIASEITQLIINPEHKQLTKCLDQLALTMACSRSKN
jgi:hypothetical protein